MRTYELVHEKLPIYLSLFTELIPLVNERRMPVGKIRITSCALGFFEEVLR